MVVVRGGVGGGRGGGRGVGRGVVRGRRGAGGLDGEGRGAHLALDLEVEVQEVPARGGCLDGERHGRARDLAGRSLGALGVGVQVGEVAVAERDEVAERAEVRLERRDRLAVPRDLERQARGRADLEAPVERDVVPVDGRRGRGGSRPDGHDVARDLDGAAQGERVAAGGDGVGVHAVGARGVPRPGHRPAAGVVQLGVGVAVVRPVGAHDDEVQALLVRDGEVGHRRARGVCQSEGELAGRAGRLRRLDLAERVAALLQGRSADHVRSSRGLLRGVVARGGVLLRRVRGGRLRQRALGDDGARDRGRGHEHDPEPGDVERDPGGGSHRVRSAV